MPEHAALSNSTTGYSPDTLVERLDFDWRPETDLWVQVALEHNQKKLGHSGQSFIRQAKARIGARPDAWTGPAQSSEEPPEDQEFEEEAPDEPAPMTEDEFWAIIARIDELAGKTDGGWEFKRGALMGETVRMSPAEIMAFADHLQRKMDAAYTWPLWAAAYIIHGGCSDDAFMGFRNCLVFFGRDIYEAALENSDSLAELGDEVLQDSRYEGMLYVPGESFEARTGAELSRSEPPPPEPAGPEWDEDDEGSLAALCPELWKRFGR
jgi:hypothetical protein